MRRYLRLVEILICGYFSLSLRNFDFKEKEEVDKYYPQFYHKMDKVRLARTAYPARTPRGGD